MTRKIFLGLFVSLFVVPLSFAADFKTLVQSSNSWNGSPLPAIALPKPEVRVLRISIAPGEALAMHKHPVINAAYLISGEITVYSKKGKERVVPAGDAIIEMVDQWHYGKNSGEGPAELVVFYIGERNSDITIAKTGGDDHGHDH